MVNGSKRLASAMLSSVPITNGNRKNSSKPINCAGKSKSSTEKSDKITASLSFTVVILTLFMDIWYSLPSPLFVSRSLNGGIVYSKTTPLDKLSPKSSTLWFSLNGTRMALSSLFFRLIGLTLFFSPTTGISRLICPDGETINFC